MTGVSGQAPLGGNFVYLTLDLVEEADLDLDALPEHAQALLALRDTNQLHLPTSDDTLTVGGNADTAILVCRKVTESVVKQLMEWPAKRLIVYSGRPETLADLLPYDCAIESRALSDVYAYTKPSYRPAEVC